MCIILKDKAKSFYLLNHLTSRNSVKDVSLYADQKKSNKDRFASEVHLFLQIHWIASEHSNEGSQLRKMSQSILTFRIC